MTTLMEKMDEIQEMTNSMEEKMAEIGMTEEEELVTEDPMARVCEECGGTGEVSNEVFETNSKEWIVDGNKKCICQLREVDDNYSNPNEI